MLISRALSTTVALALLASACNTKTAKVEPLEKAQEQTQSPVVSTPTKAKEPSGTLTSTMAEKLLNEWLKAQNSSEFTEYSALYASRFTGIKRVGPTVHQMDRRRWLHDRSGMFKNNVRVTAEKVKIITLGSTAVIRFEQHWVSSSYQDTGPKELVLLVEEGRAKITKEEMLESRVLARPQGPGAYPLHLLYRVENKQYMIIGEGASPKEVELHQQDAMYIARGKAQLSQTNPLGKWEGRALRLYDERGKSCNAVGGKVITLARVIPHFGMENSWTESGASVEQKAKDLLEWSSSQFAVEVLAGDEKCATDAAVGQPEDHARPTFAQPILDKELETSAFAAFQKLPAFKKLQKDYLADKPGRTPATWSELTPFDKDIQIFQLPHQAKRYAWVSVDAGEGCGGWAGTLAMLFEVSAGAKPQLTPLSLGPTAHYQPGNILALMDADFDGKMEYALRSSYSPMVKLYDPRGGTLQNVNYSNYDCSC